MRPDEFQSPQQALQQQGVSAPPPLAGNKPVNQVLAIATRIRNEYGARDRNINNPNNPVGNFRAWSQALDMAKQIITAKHSLIASGGPVTAQGMQGQVPAQQGDLLPEFTGKDEIPDEIATKPNTGFTEPMVAANTTERKQLGLDNLFPEGRVQQSNPEMSRTFSEPKVDPKAVSLFGHF